MSKTFVYVTYIRTTPEKLWDALTKPEFQRQYWFNMIQESTFERGAPWKLKFEDGRVADSGEVLEVDRPRRLVMSWKNEFMPELRDEGYARLTYALEADGGLVKLTVTHESDKDGSILIDKVSTGWPSILSSLKSLLETGEPLVRSTKK